MHSAADYGSWFSPKMRSSFEMGLAADHGRVELHSRTGSTSPPLSFEVRGFPSELGYFKIVCFSSPEANNVIFSPCNETFTRGTSPKNMNFIHPERDFYRGPPSKRDWAVLGLFF